MADFVVAQIAEIAQLDDFPAGFAKLVEGLLHQSSLFSAHQHSGGPGRGGRWINRQTALRVLGLKGDGRLAAAPFGRLAPLAVVAGFVGGDAKQPGLKLALTVKGIEVLDDGKEHLLAQFFPVFARQVVSELEYETPRRSVMLVKQFIPGRRFPPAAAREQPGFSFRTHAASDSS